MQLNLGLGRRWAYGKSPTHCSLPLDTLPSRPSYYVSAPRLSGSRPSVPETSLNPGVSIIIPAFSFPSTHDDPLLIALVQFVGDLETW